MSVEFAGQGTFIYLFLLPAGGSSCHTKSWVFDENTNCWGHRDMNRKSLFSICNAIPQRAVNARRQRFIHIFFFKKWGRRKGQKEILWQRKVRKYFLDWFTPNWQGSKHRVLGPIKHNTAARTIDKPQTNRFIESEIYCIGSDCLIASSKSQGDYKSRLVFFDH